MKIIFILIAVVFFSVGCTNKTTKYTRYKGPVYVSSAKYQKTSCEELRSELFFLKNAKPPCTFLRERYLFILPTEYEKLSCKQLHKQAIKVLHRYELEKKEDEFMLIGVPLLILTTGGTAFLNDVYTEPGPESYLDPKRVSENITAKEAYETLKEVVAKKNCSFVKDMK